MKSNNGILRRDFATWDACDHTKDKRLFRGMERGHYALPNPE